MNCPSRISTKFIFVTTSRFQKKCDGYSGGRPTGSHEKLHYKCWAEAQQQLSQRHGGTAVATDRQWRSIPYTLKSSNLQRKQPWCLTWRKHAGGMAVATQPSTQQRLTCGRSTRVDRAASQRQSDEVTNERPNEHNLNARTWKRKCQYHKYRMSNTLRRRILQHFLIVAPLCSYKIYDYMLEQ